MLKWIVTAVALATLAACNGVRGALPSQSESPAGVLHASGTKFDVQIENDTGLNVEQRTQWSYCMAKVPPRVGVAAKSTHTETIELHDDVLKCGGAAFTTGYQHVYGPHAEFDFTYVPADKNRPETLDVRASGYLGLCAVATKSPLRVKIFEGQHPTPGCSSYNGGHGEKKAHAVERHFVIENASGARLYQNTGSSYCLVQTPFSETLDAGVTKDNRILTKPETKCDYAADFVTTYSEPQTPTSYVWVHWYWQAPNVRLDLGQRGILCGTQLGSERIRVHRC